MEDKKQYTSLMTDIVTKQIVILGPEFAISKARTVEGITISDSGEVTGVQGNPDEALQHLVDVYVQLSGQIVKNALGTVFDKYPALKKSIE